MITEQSFKISEANKRRWLNPEFRAKMSVMSRKKLDKGREKIYEDPIYLAKLSKAAKKLRQDPEYADKAAKISASANNRRKISEAVKQLWTIPEHRAKMVAVFENRSLETKAKLAMASAINWQDPIFRTKVSQILKITSKALWQDARYRAKIIASINRPEAKAKSSLASKKKWQDLEYQTRWRSIT